MDSSFWTTAGGILKKNILTLLLLAVAMWLALWLKQPVRTFPSMVDWNTIVTLSGLLLITTGIKESGLFSFLSYRIARRIDNQRLLSLFLVFVAALLSMFLTNDIALFIVVPLTLHLQEIVEDDYSRIIIFEAIAVNVGSSLTPIGNPQNIFLWHQWGLSFPVFVREMVPLVLVMAVVLFVMVLLCFPKKEIRVSNSERQPVDRVLFVMSSILLLAFILSVEFGYERYFLPVVLMFMLITRTGVIFKADWGLILLFVVIFVDLNMVSRLGAVQSLFSMLNFHDPQTVFFSGALFSQVISNVPSAILLAHHSADYKMIAYGVNVGGNGLLIGSFANLIALRFCNRAHNYLSFHAYSIPYFIVTLVLSFYLLF